MPGKINNLTEAEQAEYLKNTYGISEIRLHEEVQHKCPLGEQVGVTKYEIKVNPGNQLAELIQLHWDIQEMMGTVFTLESGAAHVVDILKKHYTDAEEIEVTASCGTNRHMATDVVIKYVKE